VFLVKLLNSFVKPDASPFSPIHKNETPFSAFVAYFGSKIDIYTIDEHKITTTSGHILTTFRINLKDKSGIPENSKGKQVLLSHGYMSSSDSFFITGDDRSLGYWFANKGYDVWVTNMRGNRYSHSHKNPDIAPADYFNFSIDDHARDIRHWYEKIIEVSGRDQILYVGYSMGCMIGAMAHSDPELKKYLDKHTTQMIFLAPYLFGSYGFDMGNFCPINIRQSTQKL
jgi:pimeloyl-ACP methyl ester carboxylesterase